MQVLGFFVKSRSEESGASSVQLLSMTPCPGWHLDDIDHIAYFVSDFRVPGRLGYALQYQAFLLLGIEQPAASHSLMCSSKGGTVPTVWFCASTI
jgi:hypothetical protein